MQNTYSLFDLQEHVRRVVALNFAVPVWVSCEIAQHKESKGQHYLSLVQKGEGAFDIIAQADAVLWLRTYRRLKRALGKNVDDILQAGMEVRLQVRLDFHERYGLKFFVEDVDLAFTIGQLELKRRATIEALQKAKLLHKNAEFELPKVLQSIAVLSSENAAGLQDFLAQIQQNSYGYRFKIHLFPTVMQGEKVREELTKQLKKINRRADEFDVAIIIRGGGARLDLSAFDDLSLCKTVAKSKLPILTGIGHDIDESVLDLVAHTSLKTPTAVADFIIQHNVRFESRIVELTWLLQHQVQQIVQQENLRLENASNTLQFYTQRLLQTKQQELKHLRQRIPVFARQYIKLAQQELAHQSDLHHFLSVEQTLARGFSLITKSGQIVRTATDLEKGDEVTLHFADGKKKSRIENE